MGSSVGVGVVVVGVVGIGVKAVSPHTLTERTQQGFGVDAALAEWKKHLPDRDDANELSLDRESMKRKTQT